MEVEEETPSSNPSSTIDSQRPSRSPYKTVHRQRCHLRGQAPTMLPFSSFSSSKTRRGPSASYRPLTPQQINPLPTIQNDFSRQITTSVANRDLVCISRHIRRIPAYSPSQEISKVHRILPQQSSVLFQGHALRSQLGSFDLHKDVKIPPTSSSFLEGDNISLSGRLADLGNISIETPAKSREGNVNTNLTRLQAQSEEVQSDSFTGDNSSRCQMGREDIHCPPISRQDDKVREHSSRSPCQDTCSSQKSPTVPRSNNIHGSPSSPGETSILSIHIRTPKTSSKPNTDFKGFGGADSMVGSSNFQRLRSVIQEGSYITSAVDGCLPSRVGQCDVTRGDVFTKVAPRSEGTPHHIQGDVCNLTNPSKSLPSSSHNNTHSDRLCDSMCNSQQTCCSLSRAQQDSSLTCSYSPDSSMHPSGATSSRSQQYLGRCIVSCATSSRRMESSPGRVQLSPRTARPNGGRPLFTPRQCKTPNIRMPLSPSPSNSYGCTDSGLGTVVENLPVSSSCNDARSTTPARKLQRPRDFNIGLSSVQSMVATTSSTGSKTTEQAPCFPRDPGRGSDCLLSKLSNLSRLDFLKHVLRDTYSGPVTESIVRTHRDSTRNQYEHCWKTFQKWINRQPLTSISKPVLLQFLDDLHKSENLAPKTILVYRNSLHLPFLYGFNINTGDVEFGAIARSQFLAKPPAPRIVPQWSLPKVLKLLESDRFCKPVVDSSDMLMKTLFLLALASGRRGSEIAALDRTTLVITPNLTSATIYTVPSFIFKNQTASHTPSALHITALQDHDGSPHIHCPVEALSSYLQNTSDYNGNKIFINPKSGKALNAGRISFYICQLINIADPGKLPKGHDLRKVATSIAWTRGLSLDQITKHAFWKNPTVFIRHYLHALSDVPQCVALNTSG